MQLVDTNRVSRGRMPAEWEPHEATWLSWPHNPETWPRLLSEAEQAMVEVVAALAPVEHVHVNVLDRDHRKHVAGLLAGKIPPEQVTLHLIPTNDAWVRDHGAIVVFDHTGERRALDFDYNAWGGKYPPWDRDQAVARQMADCLGLPMVQPAMVLEGGSIDVNGSGCLLTTEQCLLNENRNPTMSQAEIEQRLAGHLGVDQFIWLEEGIVGDDTDGHIDDITRFVGETSIVTVRERHRDDDNYRALEENRERLRRLSVAGQPVSVTELPMPEPLFAGSERLPASYANFYVANEVVLVPVFADAADAAAIDILQAGFTTRRILPIDARALVHGLGGIHCLTQQIPAALR